MHFRIRLGRLVVFNLVLASLLTGSLVTTLAWTGCDAKPHTLSAKTVNEIVSSDKDALEAATAVQRAFRNVANSIGPAVVSINVVQTVSQQNPLSDFYGDDFFRFFFGDRGQAPQQQKKSTTVGSGFIIDKKGYILSNLHVVKQANDITVVLMDGREYKASVVGSDSVTDIALLKIDAADDLPLVVLGDSDGLEVGDWTIAIGNPFNLPGTFTVGVVSAKSRGDQIGAPYQNFIQTDTAINPGNSGGPLVNIRGEVVGVNTMIYTRTGGSLGIGFAIPINIAKSVVESLIKDGRFERGYIGIYPGAIDEGMRTALKLPKDTGVIVNSVVPDGPAARAGFKDGDVILEIDGVKISSVSQLMRLVAEIPVGKTSKFLIQRQWEKMTLEIAVVSRPAEEEMAQTPGKSESETPNWLGMRVEPVSAINARQLQRLGLKQNEPGVVIVSFEKSAPQSELAAGDLIQEINYHPIRSITDYQNFVKGKSETKNYIFKIKRQGQIVWVGVNK